MYDDISELLLRGTVEFSIMRFGKGAISIAVFSAVYIPTQIASNTLPVMAVQR